MRGNPRAVSGCRLEASSPIERPGRRRCLQTNLPEREVQDIRSMALQLQKLQVCNPSPNPLRPDKHRSVLSSTRHYRQVKQSSALSKLCCASSVEGVDFTRAARFSSARADFVVTRPIRRLALPLSSPLRLAYMPHPPLCAGQAQDQ